MGFVRCSAANWMNARNIPVMELLRWSSKTSYLPNLRRDNDHERNYLLITACRAVLCTRLLCSLYGNEGTFALPFATLRLLLVSRNWQTLEDRYHSLSKRAPKQTINMWGKRYNCEPDGTLRPDYCLPSSRLSSFKHSIITVYSRQCTCHVFRLRVYLAAPLGE